MTISKTERRAADLDTLAETIDKELAAAGERVQSAQRSLARAHDRYGELVEARSIIRGLRQ